MQPDGMVPGSRRFQVFLENYPSFSRQALRQYFSNQLSSTEEPPIEPLASVFRVLGQGDHHFVVGCSSQAKVV